MSISKSIRNSVNKSLGRAGVMALEAVSKRFLAESEVKLVNGANLFNRRKTIKLKVGDAIDIGYFVERKKWIELASVVIEAFEPHPDKTTDRQCINFRIRYENTKAMDGLMFESKGHPQSKNSAGFVLFEDKDQIRCISHMLVAYEQPTFKPYYGIKNTKMTQREFELLIKGIFSLALIEIADDEIAESAYIGLEYIPYKGLI